MKNSIPLHILLIFCVLFLFPTQGRALSCAELEEHPLDIYDAAVVGTVLNSKGDIVQPGLTGPKEWHKYVLMEIEQSWKTEFPSQIIFEADYSWGYDFQIGEKYLVYLYEKEGEYFGNSACSPVTVVHDRSDYGQFLGEGFTPTEKVNLGYKMWFMIDKDLDLIFILLGVAFFIFITWGILRNKKSR